MRCATKRKLQDEMTQHSITALEALALPTLSLEGCHAPAAAHALAPLLRQKICAALLAKGVHAYIVDHGVGIPFDLNPDSPDLIKGLTTVCHYYREARWWLEHQHEAEMILSTTCATFYREGREAQQSEENA